MISRLTRCASARWGPYASNLRATTLWITIATIHSIARTAAIAVPGRAHRALAQRVNREIAPSDRLLVVAVPNNVRTQLLYYLRHPAEIVNEPQETATAVTKGADTWLLAPAAARDALAHLGSLEVVDRSEGLLGHHREADRLTLFRLRAG